MAEIRVDKVTQHRVAEQTKIQEEQERIHLFTHSRLEAPRKTFAGIGKQDFSAIGSQNDGQQGQREGRAEHDEKITVKTRDGKQIEMPRLTAEQYADIDAILAQATPEQADYLVRSGQMYAAHAYNEIEEGRADGPYSLEASSAAQTTYEAYVATGAQTQQEDATTGAVLFGMYGVETNLKNYFGHVQDEQKLASSLRTDVAEIDEMLADWPDDGSTEVFSYREVTFNDDGSISITEHKNVEMTKGEAEALRDRLQASIDSLGTFQNSEMMQLQVMVNKYQQAMNTLSNIMKNQNDTHKAIINNVK